MTMAAALIAAVTEIDLKGFKFATIQGRESLRALLLFSRWRDRGHCEGRRRVLASTYEIKTKIPSLDTRVFGVQQGSSCDAI